MKESYFFSSEKQFSSGQSIWIEFSQEKYNKDNILLKQDCHYQREGKWKPINLELGEKTLYLRSNCGHSGYLSLNFTTMIMSKFEEQDVICFHKNNNILEIKGDDLQKLKGLLTQKCIQKTFHEDFHIEKIIADGTKKAMVFQAIRKSNKERVAVKAQNKKLINQFPQGRQILKNEIKALRMLNSEHVIVLQEVHETVNSIYLIMDLMDGGQLSQRMPLFPDKNVRQLMYNFISTLNQIHNKKLILRNISPENILFKSYASHEDLVLIDFGEVQFQWNKSAYLPFRTGGFMAPEIFENKILDGRCDIYSAGVIFYMLVVQKEQDPKKTNRIYCDLDARKFKQAPKDLQSLIKKMLREDPKHRYSAEKCLHHSRYLREILNS